MFKCKGNGVLHQSFVHIASLHVWQLFSCICLPLRSFIRLPFRIRCLPFSKWISIKFVCFLINVCVYVLITNEFTLSRKNNNEPTVSNKRKREQGTNLVLSLFLFVCVCKCYREMVHDDMPAGVGETRLVDTYHKTSAYSSVCMCEMDAISIPYQKRWCM